MFGEAASGAVVRKWMQCSVVLMVLVFRAYPRSAQQTNLNEGGSDLLLLQLGDGGLRGARGAVGDTSHLHERFLDPGDE